MRRPLPFDSQPGATPVALGSRASQRSWAQRALLVAGTALTIALLSASGFVTYQTVKISDIQRFADLPNIVEVASDQPQNWLVVGSDTRADAPGNRTDTIMIVRLDPQGSQLDILSLQRDLWVPI